MRFVPAPKKTARPKATPKRPGGKGKRYYGIFRATGSFRVCDRRNPYVSCFINYVWGSGKTEAAAKAICNTKLNRTIMTYNTSYNYRAYRWSYCRVIK